MTTPTIVILSILAGILACALAVMVLMRRYMIVAYRFDAPYETVCRAIEKAVKTVPGWGHPIPDWDFHSAVNKTHYFKNLAKKR